MAKKETTKAVLIDPKEYGLEKKEAADIGKAFEAKIAERDGYAKVYATLIEREESPEQTKEARELRLKLVKTRTGISSIHKTQKAYFLAAGKFVDAWKNKETLPITQMEEVLEEIENRAAIAEEKRLEELQATRVALLQDYVEDAAERDLSSMEEDVWESFLATKKSQYEAAQEKAEEEVKAAKAEEERLAGIATLNTSRQKELAPYWSFMTEEEQEKEYGEDKKPAFDKFVKGLKKKKDESEKETVRLKKIDDERTTLLLPVIDFVSDEYKQMDYSDLESEIFLDILSKAEKAKTDKDEADKAEKDRVAKELEDAKKEVKTATKTVATMQVVSTQDKKNKARQDELFDLGFTHTKTEFVYDDIKVPFAVIPDESDADWDVRIGQVKEQISIAAELESNKGESELFKEFITDLTSLKTKYEFEDIILNTVFDEACGMIDRMVEYVEGKIK